MEWLILVIAFLFAFALYLLYFLDRNISDKGLFICIIISVICFYIGYYLLKNISSSIHNIFYGLIYIFIGYLCIFKFPDNAKIQHKEYSFLMVFIGLISLIYGILLII
ncbi:MAG: hypothetical protein B6U87_02410 [Candidatus Aenigmarchaeota archaeon ex4484_52]|nr:MAG: hypothetical protein B6U87_02410 [Candidatus Aenigmarchaeota archaeon ex4484_52]